MEHTGTGEITLKKVGSNKVSSGKELSIPERLLLGSMLPEIGNRVTLDLAETIALKVKFSPEEIKECGIKLDVKASMYSWEKNKQVSYLFSDQEVELLEKQIDRLDKEEKLSKQILDLMKKIKGV